MPALASIVLSCCNPGGCTLRTVDCVQQQQDSWEAGGVRQEGRTGQGRGEEDRDRVGERRGSRGGGENRLGADLALLKLAPAVCVHSCTGGSRTLFI